MDKLDTNKKTILEALEQSKGIVTDACKACGIPRSTFYNWLKEDAEFKEAVEEIQEVAIDYVEGKLFQKIDGVTVKGKGSYDEETGEPPVYEIPPSDTAIIFYLKTKGKKRGYVERQELAGPNGAPIQTESKHIVEFRNYGENDTPAV